MRKGRVVIVSDYVGGESAASGGAGHAVYDSYRALRDAGVDVRIVAGFGAPPGGAEDRFSALGGSDLRSGGALDTVRMIYHRDAKRALAAELDGEDPDSTIVILHQWTRYLSPAALGLLDRFQTMIYMHDHFWACPNGAYYDFQEARPCDRQPAGLRCVAANCDRQGRAAKAGRLLRHVARTLTVRASPDRRLCLHLSTGAMRTAAPLLPGERHAIVHNTLAVPDAPPPPALRPHYDVGYFGRLQPEKGVAELIDVAGNVGLIGLFAGEGTLEPQLAQYATLEHRRWAPRAEMAAAMRSCAVVVLPSLWHETWGLIVPEAMAAGVKVLVSIRAGSAELVQRFGGGATFDPGVPGDLARALLAMQAEPAPELDDWTEFQAVLSSQRHAASIVDLAAEKFGIDLQPSVKPVRRSVPPPLPVKLRA